MSFHEDTLMRRLCVGVATARSHDMDGQPVKKPAAFKGLHKNYVYGASKLSLRPTVPFEVK